MAGSSFLICIPSSYRFSPPLIASFFRDIVPWQKVVGLFCTFVMLLHICFTFFVTLDMVNSDKMIGKIMLVVCSHPLFTNLYLPNVRAYGSF